MKKLSKLLNTVDYFYTLASGDENFAEPKKKMTEDEKQEAFLRELEKKQGLKPTYEESNEDYGDEPVGDLDPNLTEEPVYDAGSEEEDEEEPEQEADSFAPGMYSDIIDYATRRVSDSDVTDQLLIIAELYRKAIQFSEERGKPMGYKFTYDTIGALSREIQNSPEYPEFDADEDDEDKELTEQEITIDFLRDIQRDLRERAGGAVKITLPESNAVTAEMASIKKNHKIFSKELFEKNYGIGGDAGSRTKNTEDNEEKVVDEGGYEEDPANLPSDEEDEDAEKPLDGAEEEMDDAFKGEDLYKAPGNQFEAQRDANGGVTGQHAAGKQPISWVTKYKNESADYAVQLMQSDNAKEKKILTNLVTVADELAKVKDEELLVFNKLREQADAKNPTLVKQHDKLMVKLKKLRTDKNKLKEEFRLMNVSKVVSDLHSKLVSSKNAGEKFVAQQKLDLFAIESAKVTNKGAEIAARKKLLAAVAPKIRDGANKGEEYIAIAFDNSTGQPATPEGRNTISKLLAAIEEAKRIPRQTFEEKYAEEAAKKAAEMGVVHNVVVDEETGEVIKKRNTRDLSGVKLKGFIKQLNDKILGERKTNRDRLDGTKNNKLTQAQKDFYSDYLKNIADAANSLSKKMAAGKVTQDDRAQLTAAIKALDAHFKLVENARFKPEFVRFAISVRTSKFFYGFRDQLLVLEKLKVEEKESLNEQEIALIDATIARGNELIKYYENLQITQLSGEKYKTGHGPPTVEIGNILTYLENIKESTLRSNASVEDIMRLFDSISYTKKTSDMNDKSLFKKAQSIANAIPPQGMSGEDFAEKIFQILQNNMIDKLLSDNPE